MPTKFAPKRIREELKNQIAGHETTLQHKPNDPEIQKSLKRDRDMLTAITPPDVSPADRTHLERRLALIEDTLRASNGVGLATEYEMKNPNAVGEDRHRLNERFHLHNKMTPDGKVVKCDPKEPALIDEFKDLRRTLNRDAEDELTNIASIETIRPQGNNGASRLIDFPKAQFAAFGNGSYEQWVFSHLDAWPPYQGVKAGLYAPFFTINDKGDIFRDGTYHPEGDGTKANPFAEPKAEIGEIAEPPVLDLEASKETATLETGPPYTRCQATNQVSGMQCKMEPLMPNLPYCRLPNHKAQFVQDEKVG